MCGVSRTDSLRACMCANSESHETVDDDAQDTVCRKPGWPVVIVFCNYTLSLGTMHSREYLQMAAVAAVAAATRGGGNRAHAAAVASLISAQGRLTFGDGNGVRAAVAAVGAAAAPSAGVAAMVAAAAPAAVEGRRGAAAAQPVYTRTPLPRTCRRSGSGPGGDGPRRRCRCRRRCCRHRRQYRPRCARRPPRPPPTTRRSVTTTRWAAPSPPRRWRCPALRGPRSPARRRGSSRPRCRRPR